MFCTECGTKNSVDSKYCRECGTKINDGYRTMMLSLDDLRAIDNEKNQERLTKLLDMAFWHNEAGNADAAVLACEAALAIHPHSTTAHSLLGTLYEKRGDDAKAIHHFEAVVTLNPESAADAAKLDQVRRGVHVKAVAPPPAYKWIPPALMGLRVNGVAGKTKIKLAPADAPADADAAPAKARLAPLSPALASILAGVAVLIVGLMIVHAMPPRPIMHRSVTAPMLLSASARPVGFAPALTANLPPVTLTPGVSTARVAAPRFGPDPFADAAGPIGPTTPLVPSSARVAAVPPASRASRHAATSTRSVAALPPLALRAVPLPGENGLAPAPVSLPRATAYAPLASVTTLPQHTVVVSRLNNITARPSSFAVPGTIRITVHSAPADNGIVLSNRDLATADQPQPSSSAGDNAQQTALALQQQGNYAQAAASYRQAIRAYQAQIAAGRDVQTATSALQACQTGLQICQQSR